MDGVQSRSEKLDSEALLDFSQVEALEAWLAQNNP